MRMYTFININTTGNDIEKDEIIEACLVKTNFADHAPIIKVIKFEDKCRAIKEIADFTNNTTIVCHDAPHHLGFLKSINVPKFYDTKSIYTVLKPGRTTLLIDIARRYNIPWENADLLTVIDAQLTMSIFDLFRKWLGEAGIRTFLNKVSKTADSDYIYVPANAIVVDLTASK